MSVCDGCGRGHNEFAVRVQNYGTCIPAVTEMAIIFLEIVKAAAGRDTQRFRLREGCMPLWTLAIALATGKNTRLFGVLDQNTT